LQGLKCAMFHGRMAVCLAMNEGSGEPLSAINQGFPEKKVNLYERVGLLQGDGHLLNGAESDCRRDSPGDRVAHVGDYSGLMNLHYLKVDGSRR
jgi:hypothetical protein